MVQARRQYTDEFKREAVALLGSSGRPLLQIANELGISPSDSGSEISRLRRENDRLRMERDIFKRMARPIRKGLARGDLRALVLIKQAEAKAA